MSKNRFDFQAHLSRHNHDVSAGYTSSLTTGCIIPQYFDILGPGDSIYFSPKLFARLQDIVAPFFGEIDIHLDAFFVPMQMMYTPFGSVFSLTNDVISSAFRIGGASTLPTKFPLFATSTWTNLGVSLGDKYAYHHECIGKETMRLLDALDCNPYSVMTAENNSHTTESGGGRCIYAQAPENVSPWLFCAYQAIYQKFFRNEEFETFDIQSFNVDQYFRSSESTEGFINRELIKLRYVTRPNDYFTSLKVSPIASAVNSNIYYPSTDNPEAPGSRFPHNGGSLVHTLEKVNDYLGFGSDTYVYNTIDSSNSSIFPNSEGASFSHSFNSFDSSSVGQDESFTPTAANIRALFAVDKFTRIYGRAGKTYDDQIEAHFGIKIPHDVKHDLTHIKHWRMALAAEPVYSTADTGDGGSTLGQVGGQSNGTLQAKQEKFTAPVHGVFMITCYAVTKPRYFHTFSKLNMLVDRLDFPIPEFDKLGMQPLYAFEFKPLNLQNTEQIDRLSVRVGWQRRYAQFKEKYNRVSPLYMHSEHPTMPNPGNAFAPYVLSRPPFPENIYQESIWANGSSQLVEAGYLFETPMALDNVMAVKYNGEWSLDYWRQPQNVFDTDPILMDFFCDAKKVSWMSETGEPDL